MSDEVCGHKIGTANCGCGWHPSCVGVPEPERTATIAELLYDGATAVDLWLSGAPVPIFPEDTVSYWVAAAAEMVAKANELASDDPPMADEL